MSMRMKKPQHIEDDHCIALWQWAAHTPIARDYLYHIPNGGTRNKREAGRLKSMGVKAGVSDYHLPVPRGWFHGLYLEMKAPKPYPSRVQVSQRDWGEVVQRQGHAFYIVYGVDQAKAVIRWYLALQAPVIDFEQPPIDAVLMEGRCYV